MSGAPIRCFNLARWYGEVQGLSGLTVDIGPGVVGLLGPNGSGKTTLMRLLTGLARPTFGHAEVFGRRMGPDAWEVFRRIGHVPGDDVQFETERAVDFLAMLSRMGGDRGPAARTRAEEALEKVGLLKRADTRLRAMSKGMRQRVKMAQALLFDPELLLLDEPLNGMDPVSRRKTMNLIRERGRDGRTVLFASHILYEVQDVTEQVILLHHGRLLAEGRLSEIRDLIDLKPRRISLKSPQCREIAAASLDRNLVLAVEFGEDDRLQLDTRELDPLLGFLQELGEAGRIESLEIADENLEAVFDLLVQGEA